MMREIKFRAWDKELEYMFYGIKETYDWLSYPNNARDKEIQMYEKLNEAFNAKCFDSFLNNERFVVMQYTGLKDKNDKEIYEGDIVRYKSQLMNKEIWNCVIEIEGATFKLRTSEKASYDGSFLNKLAENKNIEVMGNVYENPELLEVQSDERYI